MPPGDIEALLALIDEAGLRPHLIALCVRTLDVGIAMIQGVGLYQQPTGPLAQFIAEAQVAYWADAQLPDERIPPFDEPPRPMWLLNLYDGS